MVLLVGNLKHSAKLKNICIEEFLFHSIFTFFFIYNRIKYCNRIFYGFKFGTIHVTLD